MKKGRSLHVSSKCTLTNPFHDDKEDENNSNLRFRFITTNNDHTLIMAATNKGYRVYNTSTYDLMSRVDDIQEMIIGDIEQAFVLSNSSVVIFRGTKNNSSFPRNQLVIWDDYLKRKIGLIILKQKIIEFSVLKHILFILTPDKILIFNLHSLKFITKIEKVPNTNKKVIYYYNEIKKEFIVGFIRDKKPHIISLFRMKSEKINQQIQKKTKTIVTPFIEINHLSISQNKELLVASSKSGSTLHFYNFDTFTLDYCIYLGNGLFNSLYYLFDKTGQYLFVLFMNIIGKNKEIFIFEPQQEENTFKCNCGQSNLDQTDLTDLSINSIFAQVNSEREITQEKEILLLKSLSKKIFHVDMKNEDELIYYTNDGLVNSLNFQLSTFNSKTYYNEQTSNLKEK